MPGRRPCGDGLGYKGLPKMDALLTSNPKIDLVYAHNDPMAEGAYLAAKAAGREKEDEGLALWLPGAAIAELLVFIGIQDLIL